ncbi:uncharacterized protein LOC135376728 [Ornithodoros turicata]|uniref:uncharacterized protein LOC135376728 n=1 Tax=Ornithodoros turicata TaxID=34597 RepID=UPI00313886D1
METLKAKRRSRRAQNTKIIREASALLATPNFTVEAVKSLKDRLEKSNTELDRINVQFEEFISGDEAASEFLAIAEYEDQAVGMLSALQAHYDRMCSQSNAGRTLEDGDSQNATSRRSELRLKGPKLPVLKMEPFDGDLSKWCTFWEQFEAMIHNNVNLTPSEKFHYLRHLTGSAASAIAGLPTTAACYEDALQLLKTRFGHLSQIRQTHLQKMRRLPFVKSIDDVKGLRNLYDHVEVHTRSLKTVAVQLASYASMLTDMLVQRLPQDLTIDYHRQRLITNSSQAATAAQPAATPASAPQSAEQDFKTLMNFLKIEVESRDNSFRSAENKSETTEGTYRKKQFNTPSASALYSASTSTPEGKKCLFCKKEHNTQICPRDITWE